MPVTSACTPELIDAICARIANGETLASICREPGMPGASTVRAWAMDVDWVASAIARARDLGADAIAEQAFEILDMPPAYKTTEGGQSIDQGDVANRKLQVEGRLKLLAKWNPKRYGDRIAHEHSGKVGLESLVAGDEPADK